MHQIHLFMLHLLLLYSLSQSWSRHFEVHKTPSRACGHRRFDLLGGAGVGQNGASDAHTAPSGQIIAPFDGEGQVGGGFVFGVDEFEHVSDFLSTRRHGIVQGGVHGRGVFEEVARAIAIGIEGVESAAGVRVIAEGGLSPDLDGCHRDAGDGQVEGAAGFAVRVGGRETQHINTGGAEFDRGGVDEPNLAGAADEAPRGTRGIGRGGAQNDVGADGGKRSGSEGHIRGGAIAGLNGELGSPFERGMVVRGETDEMIRKRGVGGTR